LIADFLSGVGEWTVSGKSIEPKGFIEQQCGMAKSWTIEPVATLNRPFPPSTQLAYLGHALAPLSRILIRLYRLNRTLNSRLKQVGSLRRTNQRKA
jgi:hypothetical protein